jgi:orotate phosphoribosyltransferase
MKLSDAAAAARRVGKMLATDKFARLNNHSIQDIETWDDADEDIAQDICAKVLAGQSIVASGDDAQLLAGVTMALLQKPELYKVATKSLEEALDDSFDRDPIWGATLRGHALAAAGGRAMAAAREVAEAKARTKTAKDGVMKARAGKPKTGKAMKARPKKR